MELSKKIDENLALINNILHADKSFDIVTRPMRICNKRAFLIFVDGFAKDEIMEKIMEFLFSVNDADKFKNAELFSESCVPYIEVSHEKSADKLAVQVLSGMTALIIDGFNKAVLIDARTYPQRQTSEPDKDKTFRGSKDGFVETLIFNTALIRRRIRDTDLRVEYHQVGSRSKTDIALVYMDSMVDKKLLSSIRQKLKTTKVNSLTMNQESLSEVLVRHRWYNPFPKFKYTERPDSTAAQILEGDLIILVDNSPSALILPVTLFDVIEEANDYYLPPITGTYLRLTRFLVTFLTTVLTPTWLMLLKTPSLIPEWLNFIRIDEPVNIPIFIQLLILEIAVDGLKLASLNTPNMLTTTLSMMGAIIVGDFAVKSGWFSAQSLLYMALVAISNYAQPGYELSYALKFMRLILLILTGLFGLIGYLAGYAVIFIILLSNRTMSGSSYLYPLIPFNMKDFKKNLLRIRMDNAE